MPQREFLDHLVEQFRLFQVDAVGRGRQHTEPGKSTEISRNALPSSSSCWNQYPAPPTNPCKRTTEGPLPEVLWFSMLEFEMPCFDPIWPIWKPRTGFVQLRLLFTITTLSRARGILRHMF